MDLRGKTVLVYGTGVSGIGSVHLLLTAGAQPLLYDENVGLEVEAVREKVGADVPVLLGDLPSEIVPVIDLAVVSPGVPTEAAPFMALRQAGIRIWGEIELAWRSGAGRVLAVTGTNGKTTTTALLGHILREQYEEVYVVGNIGNSYADAAPQQTENAWTAAELSSFQLETIEGFHPMGAAITNITPDHLNRHHTMTAYIEAKERIAANMTADDLLVLNYEDEALRAYGESGLAPRIGWFSSARALPQGIYLQSGVIHVADEAGDVSFLRTDETTLLGTHNYENIMTAIALARHAGISDERIREGVCSFGGVPHRIEFVAEKNGVRYYNDSKGTNPDAAIRGIRAMDRPTLLIGGGYDKNATYEPWIESFEDKVKYFALIGQTREQIAEAAVRCGFPRERIRLFENLQEAVSACAAEAKSGDAVLLSPACASWGQFRDYEERGDAFKALVQTL